MNIYDLKNVSLDTIKEYISNEKEFYYWNQIHFTIEVYIIDSINYDKIGLCVVLKNSKTKKDINIFADYMYKIFDNVPELLNEVNLNNIDIDNIEDKASRIEVQTKIDILSQVYPEVFI
jgi:hypothetical protein